MISEHSSANVIAATMGVAQSSVTRWRNTSPSVALVRQFAHSYDRPVIEAFVAAQFLDQSDVAHVISSEHSAHLQMVTAQLVELANRAQEIAGMIVEGEQP